MTKGDGIASPGIPADVVAAMTPERRVEIRRVVARSRGDGQLHRVARDLQAEVDRLEADRDAWQEAAENMADRRDEGLLREEALQVRLDAAQGFAKIREAHTAELRERADRLREALAMALATAKGLVSVHKAEAELRAEKGGDGA